ncbi:MAG TPA: threonine/serine dehydratase [Acidimicrobiia bacterium]|nr:threonine/serine dehydratase [Acidimicrobiia bacterium]
MTPDTPGPADIERAARRIAGIAVRTPLLASPALTSQAGTPVHLKVETLQPTGSFKIRGAASRIGGLDESSRRAGVVTASTGNHGRAVAHVASTLGIPATVCVSEGVPPGKVTALRRMGCDLLVDGVSQSEALVNAERLVTERGMTLVHPFDDPDVIAGQGTIGSEIHDDLPTVRTVLVPLSGGGLAAGILIALKSRDPSIRVVGVSMRRGAVMAASLERGEPLEMPEFPTLADSLQGGVGLGNRHTFHVVRDLIDEVVLVEEREIWAGMRLALGEHRLVLEGAAAVGIGALLSERVEPAGETVVVCTGSNIEPRHLAELSEELTADTGDGDVDRRD